MLWRRWLRREAADVARIIPDDEQQQPVVRVGVVVEQRTPAFRGWLYPRLGAMADRRHRAKRPARGWRCAAGEDRNTHPARPPEGHFARERGAANREAQRTGEATGRSDSNLTYQRSYFFASRRAPDAAVLTPLGEPAGGLAAQSSTVIYRPQSLVSSSDTRPPRQPRLRGYVRPALLPRTSDARFSTVNSGGERRQP